MIQKRGILSGKKVIVTRDASQAGALAGKLAAAGAIPVVLPTVEIAPPPSWDEVDQALARWPEYSWVIFSSINGVRFFIERCRERGVGPECWQDKRIAAVGPSTAEALGALGLTVDLVPERFTGRDLGLELSAAFPPPPGPALLPRGNLGREELADILNAAGWVVEAVCAYQNRSAQASPETMAQVGSAQAVLFASPSAVAGFAAMAGPDFFRLNPAVVAVAIGPSTRQALAPLSPGTLLQAEPHTEDGMIGALESHFSNCAS